MSVQSASIEVDAIVVGSGISGGWAAKELTEKGLKVLLLERGRELPHGAGYETEGAAPWDSPTRFEVSDEIKRTEQPIQSKLYLYGGDTRQYFVNDIESPYTTPRGQDFRWYRGDHQGGRSLQWARQVYRLSEMDFEANAKDGHGTDWPIRYADLAPWYDYVERFIGVSGSVENLPQLPDGIFQKPFEMNCLDQHFKSAVEAEFPDRRVIMGRCAHLTEPTREQMELGRGRCIARNQCYRGCSLGAYFSSQSATLPAAERTGNLVQKNKAIVHSFDYDQEAQRVTGVNVIHAGTGERTTYRARLYFLCASTIASSVILLNSRDDRHPNGFANESDMLGRNLMDHMIVRVGTGYWDGGKDSYYSGRRPTGLYIPRFRNIGEQSSDFLRGFGFQAYANRRNWRRAGRGPGIGAAHKRNMTNPGEWNMAINGFGEILPDPRNRVTLDPRKKDKWGIPAPRIDAKFRENELAMAKSIVSDGADMLEAAGLDVDIADGTPRIFGEAVHEMGTARMGRDPKTSVLNEWGQTHAAANLFVTDGSFMASGGCQNPSLTYMAVTARAADFAVQQMALGVI